MVTFSVTPSLTDLPLHHFPLTLLCFPLWYLPLIHHVCHLPVMASPLLECKIYKGGFVLATCDIPIVRRAPGVRVE